jgi:hypothetical protein
MPKLEADMAETRVGGGGSLVESVVCWVQNGVQLHRALSFFFKSDVDIDIVNGRSACTTPLFHSSSIPPSIPPYFPFYPFPLFLFCSSFMLLLAISASPSIQGESERHNERHSARAWGSSHVCVRANLCVSLIW